LLGLAEFPSWSITALRNCGSNAIKASICSSVSSTSSSTGAICNVITSGKYAGHFGTVESNVYQRTVDYPDEFNSGYHVVVDAEVLVTVQRLRS